ncbi:hypothetical protein PIB30_089953 [Stylosanthes scabra]|uniref:Uncharacterized protein n=1 Tax=Stylosanthes scabra TaxID=79078 RepID=A0ABU6VV40_9FABA|nr:hypothetical protein [Stylosanthes scabra]
MVSSAGLLSQLVSCLPITLKVTERRKENDLGLGLVFSVIGRQDTNWANNPADDTIPERKLDNAILNAQATTWHKLIIANVDPKQHGTTFDLNYAILIYVLMTEGVVNLPCIMRDVLLKRPMVNSHNLLPYPMFILRLASRFQVPVIAGDVFYEGDWKWEQPKVRRGRVIPPPRQPQVQQEEQQQPPPAASEFPSTSAQHLSEPSLQEIMKHLERQERLLRRQSRQIQNTQIMICQVVPDVVFTGLLSEDSSDSTEVES